MWTLVAVVVAVPLAVLALGAISATMLSARISRQEEAEELKRWMDAHRIDPGAGDRKETEAS